ncbi:MAG: ArsR family transcriptional regulator [Clostridia bacterium]|nr:ArsR family transcriptional regulator [Clostridia bacterium]
MEDLVRYHNIQLCVHEPFEFFLAMYDMAETNQEAKRKNISRFQERKSSQEAIQSMRHHLSEYQRSELVQFFTRGFQFTFTKFITNYPEISTVEQMISFIERCDELQLLRYMIRSCLYSHWFEMGAKTLWEDVSGDVAFLKSQVIQSEMVDEGLRKDLLDRLNSPEETKQRYISVLRNFYRKAYQETEQEVLESLGKQKEFLNSQMQADPRAFFERHISSDLHSAKSKLNIHLSYYIQKGFMYFLPWDNTLPHWITWGTDSEMETDAEDRVKKVKKLFKAFSDDNRFTMAVMLCEKACFVQELAEKLKIPPSSVNYHLNFFNEVGLLDTKRVNHRIYYAINQERLEDTLRLARKYFVKE